MTITPLPGRPISDSRTEMTEIVMPNDANPLGNLMGGKLMHLVDICAAICAGRHAGGPVVTAHVDQLDFRRPVGVGAVVVLQASVNYAHRTSMEIGVKMWCEDRSNRARSHVSSAYLTFVSLDPDTRTPRPVPPIIPETELDRRRMEEAEARRKQRESSR